MTKLGRPPGARNKGVSKRMIPNAVPLSTQIDPRLKAAIAASGREIQEVIQTEIGRAFPGWEAIEVKAG